METMHGLTQQQMIEVYKYVRDEYLKDEIESYLDCGTYTISDREFEGFDIIGYLDIYQIVDNFKKANRFDYDFIEDLILDEIDKNRDSILGEREY